MLIWGNINSVLIIMCVKFYRNRTFNFKVMIKKPISYEKFRISLTTDNPGKKGWVSLSDLVQKVSPLYPNAMLIRVMLPEATPGPQHWLMGMGKDTTNGELGGFFKTMHCPKCPYNREHWDTCNKVGQVSQLFFSRIVGSQLSRYDATHRLRAQGYCNWHPRSAV